MDFQKNTSAGFLINQLARLFARNLQQNIAGLGLVLGQFPILLELWEKDGLTQKELVARLDLEQATVANTLSRMERDKLVRRVKDVNDGRAQRVWLTEPAKALRAPAYAAANGVNTSALSALSAEEQTTFLALSQKLINGLRRAP